MDKKEKIHLRELAKKQIEYANLPIMDERRQLWTKHNRCSNSRPVVFTELSCLDELMPTLKCTSADGQFIEKQLLTNITEHEMVGCDRVVPKEFRVSVNMHIDEFGVELVKHRAEDGIGRDIGYEVEYPIKNLKEDISKLKPAKCINQIDSTKAKVQEVQEIIGDIMPVVPENDQIKWFPMLTMKVVYLMSMQEMMMAMYDAPAELHALMEYLASNTISVLRWQQDQGLLTLNNENHYAGSGSLGFSDELPSENYDGGQVRLKDIWLNTNSQESVGIHPAMFKEFFYPYYQRLSKEAGLLYYGCCEPVSEMWDGCIENLENIRKVSISPWCDEKLMGERLKDKKIVYCRKPDPKFIGVGYGFDEEGYYEHIKQTLEAAQGCTIEFSIRDVYTLSGNVGKAKKAIEVIRRAIDEHWK